MRAVVIALAGIAFVGSPAFAQEDPAPTPAHSSGNAGVAREVDRPLILPKGNFELETRFRTVTGTGEERSPFDFVFFDLGVRTTSGGSDLELGVSVILHQPTDTEIEGLERLWLRMQARAGHVGAFYLLLMSYNPTDSAAVRRQFAETGIHFKRKVAPKFSLTGGGGVNFSFQFWPDDAAIDQEVWNLWFHAWAAGTYQILPELATTLTAGFHVPLANRPDYFDTPGTGWRVALRTSYALGAAFDAHFELARSNNDYPYASVLGGLTLTPEDWTFIVGMTARM